MVEGMRRGTGMLRGEPLWDDGQISCPTGPMPPAPCIFMCHVQSTSPTCSSYLRRSTLPLSDVQVRKLRPREDSHLPRSQGTEWGPRAQVLAVTTAPRPRSSHY